MTIRLGSPDFLRMFPTVVWTLQLDKEASRAINPAILRGLAEIRASAEEPSAGENWQSGHALHRRDEFHALVEAIQATTRKVLSFLEIASDDFEITGCWANVNGIGASHGVHTHPNNFLRGVLGADVGQGGPTFDSQCSYINRPTQKTRLAGARLRRTGYRRSGLSCARVGPA